MSSDALRATVGTGEADLDASRDAFAVLDLVISARIRRGLTTVIDTLGLDADRRGSYLDAARAAGLLAIAVLFDTDPALCRARNRERDRPVPAPVLTAQLRKARAAVTELDIEGWDRVERVSAAAPTASPKPTPIDTSSERMQFMLQVARFPWDDERRHDG